MNNPTASSGELNQLIRDQFHQRFKWSSACFQRESLIKMKFNAAIISEIDEN